MIRPSKILKFSIQIHFLFSDNHPLISPFVKAEDRMWKNSLVGKFIVYK